MTDTTTDPAAGATARLTDAIDKVPGSGLAAMRVRLEPYTLQVGPTTHLAAEAERLAGLRFEHFDVKRMGVTIGAELLGIDLTTDLPDEAIAEIARALAEFKVVFFREQPLTAAQHVAFARRFGDLEVHPFIPSNTGQPELVRFEKSAEIGGYENAWHHDVTWRECPSMGAILHGIDVPDVGGDTLFCDMYAAYEGLDEATKAEIDQVDAVHDYLRTFGMFIPEHKRAETRATYPQVTHPLVCTHAVTGRKHLYANRNFVDHVVGLEPDESTALLDRICRQNDYPEYQCRFHWEPHSVAFWDNRAAQHYASSDYWPQVRVMERASVIGGRPVR